MEDERRVDVHKKILCFNVLRKIYYLNTKFYLYLSITVQHKVPKKKRAHTYIWQFKRRYETTPCRTLSGGTSRTEAGKWWRIYKKKAWKASKPSLFPCKRQGRHSHLHRRYQFTPVSRVNFPLQSPSTVIWERQRNTLASSISYNDYHRNPPHLSCSKAKLSCSWCSKIYQANRWHNLLDKSHTQFLIVKRILHTHTHFLLRNINRSCLDTKTFIYPIIYVLRHIPGTV